MIVERKNLGMMQPVVWRSTMTLNQISHLHSKVSNSGAPESLRCVRPKMGTTCTFNGSFRGESRLLKHKHGSCYFKTLEKRSKSGGRNIIISDRIPHWIILRQCSLRPRYMNLSPAGFSSVTVSIPWEEVTFKQIPSENEFHKGDHLLVTSVKEMAIFKTLFINEDEGKAIRGSVKEL